MPLKPTPNNSENVLYDHCNSKTFDIQHEMKVLESAMKQVCATKESARKYLVENGFLTPEGQLPDHYK